LKRLPGIPPDIKATAANAPREIVASNFMHVLRRSFEFLKDDWETYSDEL
jgi:hypothetical protein